MNIDNIMKLVADNFQATTYSAAEKLRTAIEQALTPGEPDVAGAIENGRVYADKLEADYNFECEAGPLRMCSDWVEFRRCFEWLCENITAPQPQPKQEPEAHGATHRQPITGGLYKQIGGVWHVWSRIADEPKSWIKSPGTHASGLEKIDTAPQHPRYAGVTVWLGDKTVTQVVSEQQIKYELGDTLKYAAQKCLDLLTIHKGN